MNRKTFIKKSVVAGLGASSIASSCNSASDSNASPNIISNKKYKWRMVTAWPPNFPIFGELAIQVANWIETMSNGRLTIKVFGAGELVPGFEAFEAVSSGTAEMCSSTAYYWAGKIPATQFFTGIPFGMNTQQFTAWLLGGEGYQIWKDLYAPFDLIPFLGGNTGMQPAGWFNRKINSIADLKGLKMRIAGFGAKALEKAGGAAVLLPGAEIYTSLERGVIDAAEWVGPFHDYKMGFYKIAKYYYTLGWHETTGQLEFIVNKTQLEALPKDLQEIVACATYRSQALMQSLADTKNSIYIQKIKEDPNVAVMEFDQPVIETLRQYALEALDELVDTNADAKRVFDSYRAYHKQVSQWTGLTEQPYYNKLQRV